jgi:hypothetical protein
MVTCSLNPKTRLIGIFHRRIIDAYNTIDKYPVETMHLAASWNYHGIYRLSFSLSDSSPSSPIPSAISVINEASGYIAGGGLQIDAELSSGLRREHEQFGELS